MFELMFRMQVGMQLAVFAASMSMMSNTAQAQPKEGKLVNFPSSRATKPHGYVHGRVIEVEFRRTA